MFADYHKQREFDTANSWTSAEQTAVIKKRQDTRDSFRRLLLPEQTIQASFWELSNHTESCDNLPDGPPPHAVASAPGNRSTDAQFSCWRPVGQKDGRNEKVVVRKTGVQNVKKSHGPVRAHGW